jgi:cytochrome c-type biogenesis protein
MTGAAFSTTTRFLRRLNSYANVVSIVSGVFLLYVAYLLWSDSLATLTTQFYVLNDWVFALEEWVSNVTGTGGDLISTSSVTAASLAFTAGLISFISPCVLPLVPAYVGYLSGAALSGR